MNVDYERGFQHGAHVSTMLALTVRLRAEQRNYAIWAGVCAIVAVTNLFGHSSYAWVLTVLWLTCGGWFVALAVRCRRAAKFGLSELARWAQDHPEATVAATRLYIPIPSDATESKGEEHG